MNLKHGQENQTKKSMIIKHTRLLSELENQQNRIYK